MKTKVENKRREPKDENFSFLQELNKAINCIWWPRRRKKTKNPKNKKRQKVKIEKEIRR